MVMASAPYVAQGTLAPRLARAEETKSTRVKTAATRARHERVRFPRRGLSDARMAMAKLSDNIMARRPELESRGKSPPFRWRSLHCQAQWTSLRDKDWGQLRCD